MGSQTRKLKRGPIQGPKNRHLKRLAERDKARYHVVLYEICKEKGHAVSEAEVYARCQQRRIFEMGETEFRQYESLVLERFPVHGG